MAGPASDALKVVNFWREAGRERWFEKNAAFDDEFRSKFVALHEKAAAGELEEWMSTAQGALGLILLLDQFPRNCFRGQTRMYASDPTARETARRALAVGYDMQIEEALRVFFYLPFSHSEDIADQAIGVEKTSALGPDYLKHAQGHYDVVARFGRFPHRNSILGRDSTAEEKQFLNEGGFAG